MLRWAFSASLIVFAAFAFLAASVPSRRPSQPIQFSHKQHLDYFQEGRHRQEMIARHKEILMKELEDEEIVTAMLVDVGNGSCTLCHRGFEGVRDLAKLKACAECHLHFYDREWEGREDQKPCLGCHNQAGHSYQASIPNIKTCEACHRPTLGEDPGEAKLVQFIEQGSEISWTRVYDYLPSEIVFSHERHAELGRLRCQECHGPVELAEQPLHRALELSMEDCMDCHNATGADNDCLACHR